MNGLVMDHIAYRRCCRATTKLLTNLSGTIIDRNYRAVVMPARDGKLPISSCTHLTGIILGLRLRTRLYATPSSLFLCHKIKTLKINNKTKLATISPLCFTPEAIFSGQVLSTFIPVSLAEVAKLLCLSSSKFSHKNSFPNPCLNPARPSSLNLYLILPIFQCHKACSPAVSRPLK